MKLVQSVKEKIMKNGLPEGYTRLEYLQSTGVQYIDTGYIASNTSGFSVTIMPLQASDKYFIGSRPRTVTNDRWLAGSNTGPQVYIGWNTNTFVNWTLNNVHTVQNNFMNSRTKVLDGTTVAQISETLLSQGSRTTYLFSANDATAVSMDTCRIYKAQITEGSVLVRDFIPALDPSDKPCMYDLVSKQPFYNQGTGADFSIGKKIIPVEYLESTGTQYINTSVLPVNDMEFECKFTFTSLVSTNLTIVGSRDGEKRCQPIGVYNNKWSASIGGSYDANGTAVSANTPYIIKSTITNGQIITTNVNGSQVSTCTSTTGLPSQELYVFARNFYGNIDPADSKVNGRLYFLKIKANGILVRDFIPVRDENNVGYMLDLLTNTLYANAGSGSFTIGEDDLFIRNIGKTKFFKQTTRKVPKGFQEVEYLASAGNQWIDTGVYPTQLTEAEYRCAVTGSVSNIDSHLFGSRLSASSEAFDFAYMNTQPNGIEKFRFIHGTTTTQETTTSVTASQLANPHTYYMSGTSFKVDGSEKMSFTTSSFTGTYSLWLFGVNSAGSLHNQVRAQRVYNCKIWDNDTIVRDFVPYLDASGRPCMWDMVEGKAYYNQGTEEFSYGRKIIPVEYLESTGTQYIDLGLKGKNGYDFDYKFNSTRIDNTAYGLGGLWETNKSCYLGLIRDTNYFGYHYQNTNAAIQVQPITANTDYRVQAHLYSGEQYYILNGTKSAVGTISGTFTSTNNMRLFSIYSSTPLYCYAKIYYCKIWDNGTLVRDMIPAIDENNIPYMFDKVTHSAFLNQGTGQFSYGDVIKERTETLRVIPIIRHLPLNYLESTGTQYINTGLLSTAQSKVDLTFSFTTMEGGAVNNVGVFGGRNATTTNTFTLFKIASATPQYFRFDYNAQPQVATANQMAWNTTSKYRLEYMGVQIIATNLTTSESVTTTRGPGSTFTQYPIHLFAVNTAGTIGQYLSGRIYHYWYTDGTNTIDLYPVLKLPERIPCMYDRVSKTYFYNESTDPFLYG